MGKAARIWNRFRVKISLLLGLKIAASMIALVFASSIIVSTTTYQAEIGSVLTVTNYLRATDKGFSLAAGASSANGTSCNSPVTFGPGGGIANTNITSGHLVFDVQINSTSGAPANTTYNVTFALASITYGPLCIKTPMPSVDDQTIDCKYDVGISLPSSPYSYKVIVA